MSRGYPITDQAAEAKPNTTSATAPVKIATPGSNFTDPIGSTVSKRSRRSNRHTTVNATIPNVACRSPLVADMIASSTFSVIPLGEGKSNRNATGAEGCSPHYEAIATRNYFFQD